MKGLALYASLGGGTVDDLIARGVPQVKRIAYHLLARLPASVQIDDLIQAGMLGLLEAAHRYDPAQGANFTTFSEPRIRGAMLDEIRKGDWVPRSVHRKAREVSAAIHAVEMTTRREARDQEIAEQMGLTLAEYHSTLADLRGQKLLSLDEAGADDESEIQRIPTGDDDPSEAVNREHLRKLLAAAIDWLPERERLVLSLYYDEELHLKEIGAVLGVSESRVSQLHSQALARLRARIASKIE
ncbi:MAG TPA: RNA polymerase sigma factor FliA [Candidatus Competibacteraceae bacterium]|nr:RNA polymerase sigma factor FliA [Candidatus Competibacteraceae bacterium]MCP5133983.1 RNA polymerase sigma factor FliA [Gammaproteobacteria bacterium]HPF59092.1 RNA polymerase sigma factor FliA [Candidatus Competibacteraceae bacterium]HRY19606.1 RNA polymerase sigma factor FliA [Candidatus Competibacteraceae bacterium]